jgi:hypothetical protein
VSGTDVCQDGDEAELPGSPGRSVATVLVDGQFALVDEMMVGPIAV